MLEAFFAGFWAVLGAFGAAAVIFWVSAAGWKLRWALKRRQMKRRARAAGRRGRNAR